MNGYRLFNSQRKYIKPALYQKHKKVDIQKNPN